MYIMVKKPEQQPLENPDVKRKPCVPKCMGCDRIFETKTNILFSALTENTEEISRVCRAYEDPKFHWRKHTTETVEKMMKGKKQDVIFHFDPCPLATHVSHTVMKKHSDGKLRVGQQKQSRKKKNR